MSRARTILATFSMVALWACGASGPDEVADAGSNATADDAATQNISDSGPATVNAEVYAHSSATLYRLDPNTLDVAEVATFSGCTDVIDIALDRNSNLYGTTFTGLYKINRDTAVCTLIAEGNYPNSLSFVPAGTLDPSAEALVAFRGSEYLRIDVTTGAMTTIGSIAGGLTSSGDIVSVQGGGTYLTVNGNGCDDCLVELDPMNGNLQRNWGELGFPNVFGLAYWGGTAYGFDDNGTAFAITFDASSITSTAIDVPGAPANLSFWGAGSTTIAPIID